MCEYDNIRELKIWEELKLRYQEEIEMGNDLHQNTFLVANCELEIDVLKRKLGILVNPLSISFQ